MADSPDDDPFLVRPATVADRAVLARHRCEMFKDMGKLASASYLALAAATEEYLATAIPAGEYRAWLAAPRAEPERVVAGGGVQLRRILPRPAPGGGLLPPGPQALIVNVYTEPAWRQRGLAERVMRAILAWCAEAQIPSVILHASPQGRPIYERLGFQESNEMFYPIPPHRPA